MSVLIVIPTLNENAHIHSVLQTAECEARELDGTIVVADGGSTDHTRDIVEAFAASRENVFWLDNPRRYQSAAVNLAVEKYGERKDWLIRLDAHSAYPADFCATLVQEAKLRNADSVVVSMFAQGRTPLQRVIAAAQNSRFGNGAAAHRNAADGRWIEHGHHALMRVSAFNSVGGYDPSFTHNEDAELDFRLQQAGFRIWLTAKTFVIYYPRRSVTGLIRQYANFGRGRRRNLSKHGQRPALRQAVVALLAPAILLTIAMPLSPILAMPLVLWIVGCIIAGMAILRQTGQLANIFAGPIAGLMQLAWSVGFWRQTLFPDRGHRSRKSGS